MNLKDLATDFKTHIYLFCLVVAVAVGITGWYKIPQRVDSNYESIQQLADNVDVYVEQQTKFEAVQEERKKAQDKREELMLELIRNK